MARDRRDCLSVAVREFLRRCYRIWLVFGLPGARRADDSISVMATIAGWSVVLWLFFLVARCASSSITTTATSTSSNFIGYYFNPNGKSKSIASTKSLHTLIVVQGLILYVSMYSRNPHCRQRVDDIGDIRGRLRQWQLDMRLGDKMRIKHSLHEQWRGQIMVSRACECSAKAE